MILKCRISINSKSSPKRFFFYPFNLLSGDVPFAEQQESVEEAEENTDHCLDDGDELNGAIWKHICKHALDASQRCFENGNLDKEVDDKGDDSCKTVSGSQPFLNHAQN